MVEFYIRGFMQEYNYTIILEREEDGGYHAFCPVLPGCHTQARTYDELLERTKEAISLYLETKMLSGDRIKFLSL